MSKFRIVKSLTYRDDLKGRTELVVTFLVQERYLWFFWDSIKAFESEKNARSYFEALTAVSKYKDKIIAEI